MSTLKTIKFLPFLFSRLSYCHDGYNIADIDWLNETQLLMFDTKEEYSTHNFSDIGTQITSKEVQQEQFMKFAICALVLHILIVAMGIIIYSFAYCRAKAQRKRQRANGQHRLRLSNLQHQHSPNSPNCQCQGCRLARQMFHSLVLQQLHQMAEC